MRRAASTHGSALPRPQQTPDSLRAALAAVDPARLEEMQASKDDAFAKAVEWQSLSPVQSWVLTWARDIEIARRPAWEYAFGAEEAARTAPTSFLAEVESKALGPSRTAAQPS
ncbi:hypothetical protein ABZ250_15625 [Streptomyces afghaniensis]|uniref:hypothetical protein n=1 Tax=Streptomyces afghaniensis TaxID=66865 RepID=UPI0033B8AE93